MPSDRDKLAIANNSLSIQLQLHSLKTGCSILHLKCLIPHTMLDSHANRVLHTCMYMASSPDNTMIITAASDETVRLWEVFKPTNCKTKQENFRYPVIR